VSQGEASATQTEPDGRTSAAVLDYGAGNLHSVARAFAKVGFAVTVTSDPAEARGARLMVLPGQGRFGQVMRAFKQSGLEPVVRDRISSGLPFIGICVGLQLLLDGSEEDPGEAGLGIMRGTVRRFPAGARVPQMGWNSLEGVGESPLLAGVPDGSHVYFANSYYADFDELDGNAPGATTTYGATTFRSALSLGNLYATQFHPEKSQAVGLRMLANLRALCAAPDLAAA